MNPKPHILFAIALGLASLPLADSVGAATVLDELTGAADEPDDLLPPEQAFAVSVVARDAGTLVATFTPVPGYYLYRDKFAFRIQRPPGMEVASVALPRGVLKDDPFFGKTEIFDQAVQATIKLKHRRNPAARTLSLYVKYQGCNIPLGVCFLPIEKTLDIALPAPTMRK